MNLKKIALIALAFLVVVVILDVKIYLAKKREQNKTTAGVESKKEVTTENTGKFFINGLPVPAGESIGQPIAVVIDNQTKARPQSGLLEADIVYEALAEGGITRFLAVYQSQNAKSIGPVRSARTYFAEIANEFGAVFVHVGGNSDVLELLKTRRYPYLTNVDEFFLGKLFKRVSFREMPHNVYTSIEKLKSWENYKDRAAFYLESWLFKNEPLSSGLPSAANISINFSVNQFAEKDYFVSWYYNSEKNSYFRTMGGRPHKDMDSGKQISAKNVVAQFVKATDTKTDTLYSIDLDLKGQGQALVFLDGKVVDGTWKKTSSGRTRFYNENNEEIKFNPGQIWVEIVPTQPQKQVSWQ